MRPCQPCKHSIGRAVLGRGYVLWCQRFDTIARARCGQFEREPGADE